MAVSVERSALPPAVYEKVIGDLTLKAKGLKSRGYKPRVTEMLAYDFDDGKMRIPIMYAKKTFKISGMRAPKHVGFKPLPMTFREGQKEVFDEAVKHLNESQSVFLQLACGYGKTWLAINLAAEINVRTMVLVHRNFLAEQFKTEAEGIVPGQLQIISNENESELKGNLYVCTEDRACKLSIEFLKTFDMIIVDEAKYWCTPKRLEAMLRFTPIYTIGLCAERKRKDGFDALLDMIFGPVIFRMSRKPFRVWRYYTDFQPVIERPKYGYANINWSVAMKSLAEMHERNLMIRDICRLRSKNKIMVMVTFKYHVEALESLLKEAGEDVGTFYGSAKSFKNCRILIATYSKAEMGFDDKNLCDDFEGQRLDLLILGSFYKKEIEQTAGRVMRTENPEIISITDDLPTLKKHAKAHDKWFKSRCGELMPVEFLFNIYRDDEIESEQFLTYHTKPHLSYR